MNLHRDSHDEDYVVVKNGRTSRSPQERRDETNSECVIASWHVSEASSRYVEINLNKKLHRRGYPQWHEVNSIEYFHIPREKLQQFLADAYAIAAFYIEHLARAEADMAEADIGEDGTSYIRHTIGQCERNAKAITKDHYDEFPMYKTARDAWLLCKKQLLKLQKPISA